MWGGSSPPSSCMVLLQRGSSAKETAHTCSCSDVHPNSHPEAPGTRLRPSQKGETPAGDISTVSGLHYHPLNTVCVIDHERFWFYPSGFMSDSHVFEVLFPLKMKANSHWRWRQIPTDINGVRMCPCLYSCCCFLCCRRPIPLLKLCLEGGNKTQVTK